MNTRRRTTVHDLAALRVHRDGSRVANSDTNSSSRRAKYTVRDARGNWVAKDAGGLGTVKLRPTASQPEGEQDEDGGGSELEVDEELMEEEEEEEEEEDRASPKVDKGKGRARESEDEEEGIAVNTRAQKRRRFEEDFSYLIPSAPALIPPQSGEDPQHSHPAEEDSGTFPVPSADLLKCLHYFASTYYTAMGQLYDASREFRKERKIRRAQKLKKTGAASSSDPQPAGKDVNDPQDSSGEEDIEFSEDEEEEEEADKEGEEDDKRMKRRKTRPTASRHVAKDMYKLFDGSALMALGMLLQEHVAERLEPNVPEGWEKEFAVAERDRKAAEKRAQKAQVIWNQRRAVQAEGSDQQSGEDGGAQLQEREEPVASDSSDSSESDDDD
ncbi:hypothetical protein LXA43DRAFT_1080308 [Ganoderma leucocontextum]|nr:hypothetical protein LXA43DRAFT_1080308 [Ganoderma leucocontextum]